MIEFDRINKAWLARNMHGDLTLHISDVAPVYVGKFDEWHDGSDNPYCAIEDTQVSYKNVTFENSPVEVKIEIKEGNGTK